MKKLKRWLAGLFAGVMLAGIFAIPCRAETGRRVVNPDVVSLSQGREYTNLDATGDGKVDSLFLESSRRQGLFSQGRRYLEIFINGRTGFPSGRSLLQGRRYQPDMK